MPVILLCWLFLAAPGISLAEEEIRVVLPSGRLAVASWYPGEPERPAVIIVHGFLQTREFPTVARLAAALAEEGYTVLVPTLTLGVDNRRQSLACEAVHVHTMEQDADEIAWWVRWLHARADRPVDLIGHSAGSTVLLAMAERHPRLPVRQLVLISQLFFEGGQRKEESRQSPTEVPETFELAFCPRYPAPREAFESYRRWDGDRVISVLGSLPWPATVIAGGRDPRMTERWLARIRSSGADLVVIDGAGHFFDTQHEFDLLDEVMRLLDGS